MPQGALPFRALPEDLKLRSHVEQRFGRKFIPGGMTIEDFPVSSEATLKKDNVQTR